MDKWKELIGVAAPTIATALGGPLAGIATGALCKFFGLGDGATEQEIANAVQRMTPDQVIAIKQIDADFKAKMLQANVDLERIAMADRTSARKMAMRTGIAVQVLILVVLAIMFGACLYAMFAGLMEDLSEATRSILNMAIGTIGGLLGTVVTFFTGSTSSSKEKDETIKTLSQ